MESNTQSKTKNKNKQKDRKYFKKPNWYSKRKMKKHQIPTPESKFVKEIIVRFDAF